MTVCTVPDSGRQKFGGLGTFLCRNGGVTWFYLPWCSVNGILQSRNILMSLRPTEAALHTLWFHRAVARRAVKVADIPGLDNLKAFGNAIHLYVPRIFVRRRNPGRAGLSATRAPKILNPTVAGHPSNTRRNLETFPMSQRRHSIKPRGP